MLGQSRFIGICSNHRNIGLAYISTLRMCWRTIDVRIRADAAIQRDRDARVSEHVGDDLGVDTPSEKERHAGVPEVVEADGGQPGTL